MNLNLNDKTKKIIIGAAVVIVGIIVYRKFFVQKNENTSNKSDNKDSSEVKNSSGKGDQNSAEAELTEGLTSDEIKTLERCLKQWSTDDKNTFKNATLEKRKIILAAMKKTFDIADKANADVWMYEKY